jgi:hypothetical protein
MLGIIALLYNFGLVAGTAYLVAVYDWSGWWFLVTLLFMVTHSKNDKT